MKRSLTLLISMLGCLILAPIVIAEHTVLFHDDFESAGSVSHSVAPDVSDDYDPDDPNVGTWNMGSEWFPQDIQVTDNSPPGAASGNNYLRCYQSDPTRNAIATADFTRTIYADITVSLKMYIPYTGAARVLTYDPPLTTANEFVRFGESGTNRVMVKDDIGTWREINATFENDTWFTVKIASDIYNGIFTVSIDNSVPEVGYAYVSFGHARLQVYPTGSAWGGDANLFVDDVLIYTGEKLPTACAQAIGAGYGIPSDLSGDCYVNVVDLATMAGGWLNCWDPQDAGCDEPW